VRDLRPAPDGIWVATDLPAGLWHFDPRTQALTPMVHLAGTGEAPRPPAIRMAEHAADRGVVVEAWQEADGPLQWAQVRLGTNGPVLHWHRTAPADWASGRMDPGTGGSEWVATSRSLLRRNGARWERVAPRESETLVEAVAASAEGGL
jgi:hypothetical protein